MKSKRLHEQDPAIYALVFEKDDEVLAGLEQFAHSTGLMASHFTGLGAFSDVTLRYFNRQQQDYRDIRIDEQVEVLTLAGNIMRSEDGAPKIHAHVVLGKADGTAHGGHLDEATVWPTLELVVTETPEYLRRVHDPETGLALIDIGS